MTQSVTRTLNMRLDKAGKEAIVRAAALRRISISDYIRAVLVKQAEREMSASGQQLVALSPAEQLDLWNALHAPVKLSARQRRLGRLMRGEE